MTLIMINLRSLIGSALRVKPILNKLQAPIQVHKHGYHGGPPQPFDNLPFSVPNRYIATVFFSVFFGVGLWAPFLIVWYSMAKKTM